MNHDTVRFLLALMFSLSSVATRTVLRLCVLLYLTVIILLTYEGCFLGFNSVVVYETFPYHKVKWGLGHEYKFHFEMWTSKTMWWITVGLFSINIVTWHQMFLVIWNLDTRYESPTLDSSGDITKRCLYSND